ncbi:MAG TPA: prepilin peptidase [Terriglobales bacterium]|nr:prepilin peptidase [Terriglobales bacterium]
MPGSIELALVALVTAAAWSDFRTRRIPNWITVPGAALGFALQAWYGGFHGVLVSFAGAGVGLGIFIAMYIAGGMGAGDVKLFSAVGAFVGPQALILVFVFTGLLGGIAAVALSISRGRLRQTLGQTGELLLDLGRLRWQETRRASAAPDSLRLPYGVVIAVGTLVSLVILH